MSASMEQRASAFSEFVQRHAVQLYGSGVPERYWARLFQKLEEEIFDAGSVFSIAEVEVQSWEGEESELQHKVVVIQQEGLQPDDENNIFLIDHAWIYRPSDAFGQLMEIESLRSRMAALMGVETEDRSPFEVSKELEDRMWLFNQTYSIFSPDLDAEERTPVWYVMDEFGSRIRHSDEATARCVPFYYMDRQVSFSLLWLTEPLDCGEEVSRDYAAGVTDATLRKLHLSPWFPVDSLEQDVDCSIGEPDDAFFMSGRRLEVLPEENPSVVDLRNRDDIKVFTDMEFIEKNLTDPRFTVVDEGVKADILWIRQHYDDYRALGSEFPNTLINQFPFENVLTVKDLFAIIARRGSPPGRSPPHADWQPLTFNLKTELPQFVSYFLQKSAHEEEDNTWIVKPWNLARGMDTLVTPSLSKMIRLAASGPKIACKYIDRPVLFQADGVGAVKFDIRYIILLRSVEPLRIFVYKVFWLRFANRPFSMDNFHEYEKHFTVMNYRQDTKLRQVHYDEFMPAFEQQYPQHTWNDVQSSIFSSIRKLFEAAKMKPPPRGIGHYPQSRAMYAVDLMLKWAEDGQTMVPQLLEINYGPDCTRACKYHPSFVNDVFTVLFLDEFKDRPVIEI